MVNGKMTIPTKELQNGNKLNYTHFSILRQPFFAPYLKNSSFFQKKASSFKTGTIPPEEEKRKENRPGSLKLTERWI